MLSTELLKEINRLATENEMLQDEIKELKKKVKSLTADLYLRYQTGIED